MTNLTFAALRQANVQRDKIWDADEQFTPSFRSTEASGEIGEAVEAILDTLGFTAALAAAGGRISNVVKKLERERMGIVGSHATLANLADELADAVISSDLLAMEYGIDLSEAVRQKFNKTSEKYGLPVFIEPSSS